MFHLSTLQEKDSSDSVQLLEKAQARATELEKQVRDLYLSTHPLFPCKLIGGTVLLAFQVEVLKNFLEQKNKEKVSTEARSSEAEKKLNELNSRLDKVCSLLSLHTRFIIIMLVS